MSLSDVERIDMRIAIINASGARERLRIPNTDLSQAQIDAYNAGLAEGQLQAWISAAKMLGVSEQDTDAFMKEGAQPTTEAAS